MPPTHPPPLQEVIAFAPGTVANVACAYDILGFALHAPGDKVRATHSKTPGVRITKIHGGDGQLPLEADKNTAGVAVAALLSDQRSELGVELEIFKEMPLGSGLGSSAASAAAALVAVNRLLGDPYSRADLVRFGMGSERAACGSAHADNIAPALLGGFVLIRSYDPLELIQLPAPSELRYVVIHPSLEVETGGARNILRQQIDLSLAVAQWGNIAGLVAGICHGDLALIGRSLQDKIIEPQRALLVPGFYEAKAAALAAGALGCSLSGSGPAVFALCASEGRAHKVTVAVQEAFSSIGVNSTRFTGAINPEGAKVIAEAP